MWIVATADMNNDGKLRRMEQEGWEPFAAIPVGTMGFYKILYRKFVEPEPQEVLV